MNSNSFSITQQFRISCKDKILFRHDASQIWSKLFDILNRYRCVTTTIGIVDHSIKRLVNPLPKYHSRRSSEKANNRLYN